MATINSRIHPILKEKFHELLKDELLAHVRFVDNGAYSSYSLFEYVEEWSKFARIVDTKLGEACGESVFTRKYNKDLLAQIQKIADEITPEDLVYAQERFKSAWLDGGF
jgi:hypothetical protein